MGVWSWLKPHVSAPAITTRCVSPACTENLTETDAFIRRWAASFCLRTKMSQFHAGTLHFHPPRSALEQRHGPEPRGGVQDGLQGSRPGAHLQPGALLLAPGAQRQARHQRGPIQLGEKASGSEVKHHRPPRHVPHTHYFISPSGCESSTSTWRFMKTTNWWKCWIKSAKVRIEHIRPHSYDLFIIILTIWRDAPLPVLYRISRVWVLALQFSCMQSNTIAHNRINFFFLIVWATFLSTL